MANRKPDGQGRISVDLGPHGPMLTVAMAEGETVEFEIPADGTAVELAACFFMVALLEPGADPEKLTARFGKLLEEKGRAYERAQKAARKDDA